MFRFVGELLKLLVCKNEKFGPQIQKNVKELVGHEMSPALYPILFDQIKFFVEKFFDSQGQVNLFSKLTFFMWVFQVWILFCVLLLFRWWLQTITHSLLNILFLLWKMSWTVRLISPLNILVSHLLKEWCLLLWGNSHWKSSTNCKDTVSVTCIVL